VAWRGSAHAAMTAPRQRKTPTSCRQGTTRTSTRSRQGKGRAARDEARGCHGRNPRCGRQQSRGHREAISKISRTGRCAVARSTERTPSRRLALARAVGIERGGGNGDSVGKAEQLEMKLEREERRGEHADWPGRGRPSHLVGLDQVG
jgi:hypothetical protein